MFAQHFFFYTISVAIILITLFVLVIFIYLLIVFKKVNRSVNNVAKSIEIIKEKISRSSWVALIGEAIRETISFLKSRKEKK
ncbi:hypothetical protein J7K86_02795 [bacterium]|nr:hypothetical protein [bacterium]